MKFERCYGCVRKLEKPGGVCPRCGYDNAGGPAAQPDHALPCGAVLAGHYVVGRVLGQGGFGITYIGWNLSLEQRVCIKEYFPSGASMRSQGQNGLVLWGSGENAEKLKARRESFVKEARKAAKLSDLKSVVKVWDVFYENDTSYIVMNYIEGKTLKSWLVELGKPISEQSCITMLEPVMRDIEQTHARGIVHRDIKPDNLMRQPDGKIMLLDLGSAKDLSGGNGQSSFMVASQGFSPLEQYNRHGKIGPWTDVYAMCATIFYCVTGRLLPSPTERMSGEKIDFGMLSPPLRTVMEKGLAIRPEERFQSIAALRAALTDSQQPGAVSAEQHPAESVKPFLRPEPPLSSMQDQWYGNRYRTAKKLMEDKQYAAAASLFSSMGNYMDSQKLAGQCEARTLQEQNKEKRVQPPSPAIRAQGPKNAPERAQSKAAAPQKNKGGTRILGVAAVIILVTFTLLWIRSGERKKETGQILTPTNTAYVDVSGFETASNELLEEGNRYLETKEYDKAMEAFRKSAAAGNAAAMTNIGFLYEKGLGVEKNEETAFDWFMKGAEAGDSTGMFWVGWCYYYKLGVAKSYETALVWCLRAAEAGNAEAMNWVSDMYRYGQGTPVDMEKAEYWRQRALEAGYNG